MVDTNSSIPQTHNALNINHENYEIFQPGAGNDTIDGKGGYDELSYTNSPTGMTINLSTSSIIDGWGNTDTIASIEGLEATNHDDTIAGSDEDNSLDGRFGNNTIDGGYGFDFVEYNGGGRGNVNVDLSNNTATFSKSWDETQTYTDILYNIEGVIGSNNDDIIVGDGGNNILEGARGDDEIRGGDGDDILVTGHGNDKLYGDGGNDTLIAIGSGVQHYDGGADVDTLILNTNYITSLNPDYENQIEIDLNTGESGQVGNDQLRDTITNIENVTYEGLFDAKIRGDVGDNVLIGGVGDDVINGYGGNDTLKGNDGNDIFTLGGYGETVIDGGSGIDTFRVGLGKLEYPRVDTGSSKNIFRWFKLFTCSDTLDSPLDLSGSYT